MLRLADGDGRCLWKGGIMEENAPDKLILRAGPKFHAAKGRFSATSFSKSGMILQTKNGHPLRNDRFVATGATVGFLRNLNRMPIYIEPR